MRRSAKSARIWDSEKYLMLTGASIKNMDSIRSAAPQKGHSEFYLGDNHKFCTREEATAWVLTAKFRQLAYSSHTFLSSCRGLFDVANKLPVHTWVLGPPKSLPADLQDWFSDEPEDTDYRVIIHRAPLKFNNHKISAFWADNIYGLPKRPICDRKFRTANQIEIAQSFLERISDAYSQDDPNPVIDVLKQSNHPYWHSEGRPIKTSCQ